MASCTRVKNLVQAYIDGELNHADRVIVELHVSECGACADEYRDRQRLSALMFEAMAEERLSRNLSQSVLENLPEMQPVARDMQEYNWRVKHSHGRWRRIAPYLPATALAFLVLIALILTSYWPREALAVDAVGIVTQVRGDVVMGSAANPMQTELRSAVRQGDGVTAGKDGRLAMRLSGSTEVKVAGDSRVRVMNSRHLWVESGATWMNVAPNGRLFRVSTPMGEVTVLGTVFSVAVDEENTVVTVEDGEVHVAQGDDFTIVELGQQARLARTGGISKYAVDAAATHRWAYDLMTDAGAENLFASKFTNELRPHGADGARSYTWEHHLAGTEAKAINGMVLSWQNDGLAGNHCSYDLYATDGKNNPLFKCRIDGSVFDDPATSSYQIELPNGRIEGVRWIQIRLIPDYRTGETEMTNMTILIET